MFLWLMASVLYYFNHQNSLHHHFTAWCFWSHFWRTTFVNVWVYDSSWQIFGSYLSSQFTFYHICQWMHNMTNSPVLLWCFHFMPSSSGSHLLLCGHDVQGTDVKALCLSTIELYHSHVLPHCSIYLSFLVILSSCCCDNIGRKEKKILVPPTSSVSLWTFTTVQINGLSKEWFMWCLDPALKSLKLKGECDVFFDRFFFHKSLVFLTNCDTDLSELIQCLVKMSWFLILTNDSDFHSLYLKCWFHHRVSVCWFCSITH